LQDRDRTQAERSSGRFLDVRRAVFSRSNDIPPEFVTRMPHENEQSCRAAVLMLDKSVDVALQK
jgi:hypothetical protein